VSSSELSHDEFFASLGLHKQTIGENIPEYLKGELRYIIPESAYHWPRAAADKDAIMSILGGNLRKGVLG